MNVNVFLKECTSWINPYPANVEKMVS